MRAHIEIASLLFATSTTTAYGFAPAVVRAPVSLLRRDLLCRGISFLSSSSSFRDRVHARVTFDP
jgi:hypothetical protein